MNSDDTIKFVIITQFPLAKWKRSYLNSSTWNPAHANFRSKICYSLTFGFLTIWLSVWPPWSAEEPLEAGVGSNCAKTINANPHQVI